MQPPAPILPLDALLVDQIAAGEVVERPASVAKELVENALDAGATTVTVTLEGGGLDALIVTDDGSGMLEADLQRSILRHATSKIRTQEELARVGTLGFRGEALASIGSVARLSITTRTRACPHATRLEMAGGQIVAMQPAGAPVGTTVVVRELFYNTPARRKFMRAPATEQAHVRETLLRVLLAARRGGLVLQHGSRRLIDLPASASAAERAALLLGRRQGPSVAIDHEAHGVAVSGTLAPPALARGEARGMWCFVNGRFVRDRMLQRAIQAAMGALDGGGQAAGLVFLDLPADEVDVNVHPQKLEVRFSDEEAVYGAVHAALARAASALAGELAQQGPDAAVVPAVAAAPEQRAFRGATGPAWRQPAQPREAGLGGGGQGYAALGAGAARHHRWGGGVSAAPQARTEAAQPERAPSAGAAWVAAPAAAGAAGGPRPDAEGGPAPSADAGLAAAMPASAGGAPAPETMALPGLAPEVLPPSPWLRLVPLGVAPTGWLCCRDGAALVLLPLRALEAQLLGRSLQDAAGGRPQTLLLVPTWTPEPNDVAAADDYLIETAEVPSPWGVVLEAVGPGRYVVMAVPAALQAHPPVRVATALVRALHQAGRGCHAAYAEGRQQVVTAWVAALLEAWPGPEGGGAAVWGPGWLQRLAAAGIVPTPACWVALDDPALQRLRR